MKFNKITEFEVIYTHERVLQTVSGDLKIQVLTKQILHNHALTILYVGWIIYILRKRTQAHEHIDYMC